MPNPTAAALVVEALAIRKSHLRAPAIDVLDLVIKGRSTVAPHQRWAS